jgi:hypothetical protein
VAALAGLHERAAPQVVVQRAVRARAQQRDRHVAVALHGGQHERGAAVVVRAVRVEPLLQHLRAAHPCIL